MLFQCLYNVQVIYLWRRTNWFSDFLIWTFKVFKCLTQNENDDMSPSYQVTSFHKLLHNFIIEIIFLILFYFEW